MLNGLLNTLFGSPAAASASASAASGPGPSTVARPAGARAAPAGQGSAAEQADPARPSVAQTWANRRPLTVADRKRWASRPPSFTELLPWNLYSSNNRVFELEDGQSIGLMFELAAIPCEAQTDNYLEDRRLRVQEALHSIPESDVSPWIVQFFVNDDRNITSLKRRFEQYVAEVHAAEPARAEAVMNSAYTRDYINELGKHLDRVSGPDGLFTDTQVTGQVWRGQVRRVHCFIYKRFANLVREPAPALEQISHVATTLMASLSEAGVGVRRCNGQDFYEWLLPFFNRGVESNALLASAPYPGDRSPSKHAPIFGWGLAEHLSLSEPRSDAQHGLWDFDGVLIKAVTLQNLKKEPDIGHFTAELQSGKERFARFDRLPPNSMLSITVVVQPQFQVERHVQRIRDASRARTASAEETHAECEAVLQQMVRHDKLFPTVVTLYLAGDSREHLSESITTANAQLRPSGLAFIDPRNDLVPLDTFVRCLPFCWDPIYDERDLRRSRLVFSSHIANLLPLYGRTRGTPHPGFWFWNRGGEPVWIDPLNKRDRKKNGHLLLLGPTGAGKSATAVSLCMQVAAVHRPRMVIVDAGNSFKLLVAHFASLGLSTHVVALDSEGKASVPPFFNAYYLLQDAELMESFRAVASQGSSAAIAGKEMLAPDRLAQSLEASSVDTSAAKASTVNPPDSAEASDPDADAQSGADKRDYLAEMVLSSAMMITGGEAREIEKMTRADRFVVSLAIIQATLRAHAEGAPHPLVHDVARELLALSRGDEMSATRRARVEEMGHALMVFTQGMRGKLFNRYGTDWPDADVTLVEMGALTQDGYKDALALAYTSLIDSVQARGERYQADDRPLVVVTDEGHLITTNELLGPKIAMATKMWRKLNIWFWLLTQNLQDFPDSMSRVLSMCEWWILLTMDPSEADEVTRFRSLTAEQRHLVLSAKKEPPKYTEGVVLSAIGQMLFRNIPPPLSIALAMTEGHEKAARRRLMEEHGCDELQAARLVAQQLERRRA